MATEAKRGCGYRKVGGLYLVGGGVGVPCDRLPYELTVCPCCSQGIKQSRGWTWIDVAKLFQGPHLVEHRSDAADVHCDCGMDAPAFPCALCHAPQTMGRAGLLWIGEKFYPTADSFIKEGVHLGFSRRLAAVPQDFKIGETYVLLAHPKAIRHTLFDAHTGGYTPDDKPGIFYVWMPQRLERIYPESKRGSAEVEKDAKRNIAAVFVPDSDPDHRGNVFDDAEREKRAEEK